jgi:L-aspartate oxidase
MTQDVGIVKSDSRLDRAERMLEHIEKEVSLTWEKCRPTQDLVELRNLVILSKMVVGASKNRRVNVGLHYNLDLI